MEYEISGTQKSDCVASRTNLLCHEFVKARDEEGTSLYKPPGNDICGGRYTIKSSIRKLYMSLNRRV
jgi:hypothetical protein